MRFWLVVAPLRGSGGSIKPLVLDSGPFGVRPVPFPLSVFCQIWQSSEKKFEEKNTIFNEISVLTHNIYNSGRGVVLEVCPGTSAYLKNLNL